MPWLPNWLITYEFHVPAANADVEALVVKLTNGNLKKERAGYEDGCFKIENRAYVYDDDRRGTGRELTIRASTFAETAEDAAAQVRQRIVLALMNEGLTGEQASFLVPFVPAFTEELPTDVEQP